ncbi:TonB-dependent receptor [Sediminibacterium goheungense]|uniref:TonB-dependent receptor-like protein n=1 Tax=Sediminibacterium goheungense TaxID=1086393 RepID=A0A4R6IZH5_9BACT|nr:TonB-dependent receptor [Sediminibacterium goheungense]TDO28304.1 TonB-dependent receptor-like protein [Sediminibacterium goheungense]
MRRFYSKCLYAALATAITIPAIAQQTTTVSGSVKNASSKEALSAVSVTIKGGTVGTFTDDKGNFRFTTVQKPPFTLVISSVGYASKEVSVKGASDVISVDLTPSFTLGDEVVVSASRVPERILESPVSIERISTAAIRNTPQLSYYDMLTNLKGVDVVTASLTFRSVGTRGFNSSGNTRLNQLVDGMDNQAPGLNFSVGSVIGLSELDVDNMELLPGASSALYGPGGMNGTVLINSKNPFKYQGFSFQVKQGINHIDSKFRGAAPYYDWSLRWAKKVSEKLAFKINAQFVQAQDWLAGQGENYSRILNTPNGSFIPGSRNTDPNYDGVNYYGDETSQTMSGIASQVFAAAGLTSGQLAAFNGFLAANPGAKLAQFNAFLNGAGAGALVTAGVSPLIYGASPARNYLGNQAVSRTGYYEADVVDPTTLNMKLTGGIHYKLTDKIEASFNAYFGTGNSVYTGSDRYSLKDLRIAQFKYELKHKNWYARYYSTHENAGNSFNATITTRLYNEAWKPSSAWYPQYIAAYVGFIDNGGDYTTSHSLSRAFADQGRPTGFIGNSALFQSIARKPISQGGGLFLDRSRLKVFDGQYNLTEDLGLAKTNTDWLIGVSAKQYVLNSEGTLFADTAGVIKINEFGAYTQVSQRLFNDILKLTVSGRYDKNTNFKGRFTPRASAVVKLAKDHNLRFSYQTAYRFPTTQNQWINLTVGGGTRLLGGLPQLRDFYKFNTNPVFTLPSVQAFGASALAGAPNPNLLQQQSFGEFKPESMRSFEVGYKGLIAQKLLIDVYAYWGRYKDFLSSVVGIQSRNATFNPADVLNANTRIAYSISVNAPGEVNTSGWGASVEYLLPKNFSFTGNLYHDQIGALPTGFVSYFNTPKYRVNMALNNTGFGKDNRYGFSIQYRWANSFLYEGTFGTGVVPYMRTVDAMVSYKLPATKSMIKIGGTNIFNNYYRTGWGNPSIGGLYYVSFGYNVF